LRAAAGVIVGSTLTPRIARLVHPPPSWSPPLSWSWPRNAAAA